MKTKSDKREKLKRTAQARERFTPIRSVQNCQDCLSNAGKQGDNYVYGSPHSRAVVYVCVCVCVRAHPLYIG